MNEFILLLSELRYHPHSYLQSLTERFEVTSVVNIHSSDELRKYNKRPLFNDKYLVIFDDVKVFSDSLAHISFSTMFPVVYLETKSGLEDAKFICREHDIPFKVYRNEFTEEIAHELIRSEASETVSDEICKAIVRQTGLSPLRIITAVGVCEQLGYTKKNIERYIDKWVYPDVRNLIECLLGAASTRRAIPTAMLYLQLNRHWYRLTRKTILDEIESVLEVYKDKMSGLLESSQLLSYIESRRTTRSRVMFALSLYERVSIASVFALREFIKSASLMEVALRLC